MEPNDEKKQFEEQRLQLFQNLFANFPENHSVWNSIKKELKKEFVKNIKKNDVDSVLTPFRKLEVEENTVKEILMQPKAADLLTELVMKEQRKRAEQRREAN